MTVSCKLYNEMYEHIVYAEHHPRGVSASVCESVSITMCANRSVSTGPDTWDDWLLTLQPGDSCCVKQQQLQK